MRNPDSLLSTLGRGRRASTIRRRILDWRRASRFFSLSYQIAWPKHVSQVLEYTTALIDGGSGSSAVERFVHALRFLEVADGVSPSMQLSRNPLVDAAVEEWKLVGAGGITRVRRQAPQTPLPEHDEVEPLEHDDSATPPWKQRAQALV